MRAALALVALAMLPSIAADCIAAGDSPQFRGDELVRPEGYDRWPLVGASIGLSYAESMEGSGPGAFHRVYINPSAYEAFRRTRSFPDGTTLVLEIRESAANVSIARGWRMRGRRPSRRAGSRPRRTGRRS